MIQVIRISLPKDRLRAMPSDERALFFLLGYAANQINMFRKLLIFSTNKTPEEIIEQRITGAHTQMLLRIMIGILHEVWLLISRRFLKSRIGKEYVPILSDLGRQSLEDLKAHFGQSSLLAVLRNSYAFHYPDDISEIDAAFEAATNDKEWEGDWNLYPSQLVSNSFNFAADLVIIHGMCRAVGETHLVVAQKKIMKEVGAVGEYMMNFIAAVIEVALKRHFEGLTAKLAREITDAPGAFDVWIPFYVEEPAPHNSK